VAWLGNSEQVARLHYLQMSEEHFASEVVSKEADEAWRKIRRTHGDALRTQTLQKQCYATLSMAVLVHNK